MLSASEEQFILGGCRANIRNDGRQCEEYRRYQIITESSDPQTDEGSCGGELPPPLILSSGSARLIELASSTSNSDETLHLLCAIHPELVRPSPQRPRQGLMEINIDVFRTGGGSRSKQHRQRQQIEKLTALLTDLIIGNDGCGGWLSSPRFCVVPNQTVWKFHVDIMSLTPIPHYHALVEPCSHLIWAALAATKLPRLALVEPSPATKDNAGGGNQTVDWTVDGDWEHAVPVLDRNDESETAVSTTVVTLAILKNVETTQGKSGVAVTNHVLWDATVEEHAVADAHVHVSLSRRDGPADTAADNDDTISVEVCAIDTSGSIPTALLPNLIDAAVQAWPQAQQAYNQATATTIPNMAHELPMLQSALFIQ